MTNLVQSNIVEAFVRGERVVEVGRVVLQSLPASNGTELTGRFQLFASSVKLDDGDKAKIVTAMLEANTGWRVDGSRIVIGDTRGDLIRSGRVKMASEAV